MCLYSKDSLDSSLACIIKNPPAPEQSIQGHNQLPTYKETATRGDIVYRWKLIASKLDLINLASMEAMAWERLQANRSNLKKKTQAALLPPANFQILFIVENLKLVNIIMKIVK